MIGHIELPERLKTLCQHYQLEEDLEGESPAEVFKLIGQFETLYLKIGHRNFSNTTYSIIRERDVMLWLSDKINVPEVLDYLESDEHQFLLMKRLDGEGLYDKWEKEVFSSEEFVDTFAEAIKQLQAIQIDDCPFDSRFDVRLLELRYLINHDLIAHSDFATSTLPFSDPESLYQHLLETKFEERLVFSHGDMNDANIVVDSQGNIGLIDWGRGGCADIWCDIAHAAQNIWEETKYKALMQRFFTRLQIEKDKQKIKYHLLLDTLF
ncbi:MAG: APH(3') family aminoglycoside O-phosphotransferase [Cyanobacteria bacterium P01_A01_bin.3]